MKAIALKLSRGKSRCDNLARLFRRCCFCFVFFAACGASFLAQARETVTIAVAANFKSTLEQLIAAYQDLSSQDPLVEQNRIEISISSASTGILFNQISRGAPFDIFMSADEARAKQLEAQFTHSPSEVYAIGRLVYWFPAQSGEFSEHNPVNTENRLKNLIFSDKNRKIALANPKLAPYGSAAQSVLRQLGVEAAVKSKFVMGNNIAQVFQFVYSGAASSGFVALSQIQRQSISAEQWLEVPVHANHRIYQRMILLNPSKSATSVYHFLKSEQSRQIIKKNGYALPGENVQQE